MTLLRHSIFIAILTAVATAAGARTTSETIAAWITRLHTQLLGRPADASAIADAEAILLREPVSGRQMIASAVIARNEYRQNVVRRIYSQYLHRPANGAESGAAMTMKLREIRIAALASDDYWKNAGGTAPKYVNQLFIDVCGRPADPGAQQSYGEMLKQPGGRTQVATAIVNGNEARAPMAVTALWSIYVNGPPIPGAVDAFGIALRGNQADEQALAGALASQAYYNG